MILLISENRSPIAISWFEADVKHLAEAFIQLGDRQKPAAGVFYVCKIPSGSELAQLHFGGAGGYLGNNRRDDRTSRLPRAVCIEGARDYYGKLKGRIKAQCDGVGPDFRGAIR